MFIVRNDEKNIVETTDFDYAEAVAYNVFNKTGESIRVVDSSTNEELVLLITNPFVKP